MKIFHPAARILWYEAIGFSAILAISWANELEGFARSLLGGVYASNWQDAAVDSFIILLVAVPTIFLSWRISKRLYYLEGFLRMCAWCRKVGEDDEWITIEEFVEKTLETQTSHGICPECYQAYKERQARIG